MGFKIREIDTECKFSSALTVEALSRAIPSDAITRVLAQEAAHEERERKLTMPVVVWLIIALHLYTTLGSSCFFREIYAKPEETLYRILMRPCPTLGVFSRMHFRPFASLRPRISVGESVSVIRQEIETSCVK